MSGSSNIVCKAMDLPTVHFNEIYTRHHKQVWHVTCDPTFLQSCGLGKIVICYSRGTLESHANFGAWPRWVAQKMSMCDHNGSWVLLICNHCKELRYSSSISKCMGYESTFNYLFNETIYQRINWITLSTQTCQLSVQCENDDSL